MDDLELIAQILAALDRGEWAYAKPGVLSALAHGTMQTGGARGGSPTGQLGYVLGVTEGVMSALEVLRPTLDTTPRGE